MNNILNWPTVIGHRGLAGLAPENTLPAFQCAIDNGLRWVELDAKLCASGEVVVFHDNRVERTTNGHGRIGDLSWSQLQQLEAGAWFDTHLHGTRIPLLSEVLELCAQHKVGINIELKPNPDQYTKTAQAVAGVLDEGQFVQRLPLLVSSFSRQCMIAAKRYLPQIPRGLLLDRPVQTRTLLRWLSEMNCVSCHLNSIHVNADLLDTLHNHHYHTLIYTVNSDQEARQWLTQGVSGVFSDFPLPLSNYARMRK